ncbi:hypothetical protein Adt_21690 [Abeliophyllum distichum]|uniref:Uncharacterized protein n=1 Tax=Abeliophyllum distichum TaxID=126358 RepID=A0ABD1T029_9LAMI
MNLVQGLVLAKELFDTIESFDRQCSEEEVKSKKLSEDLKVMSLEKAQLESDKRKRVAEVFQKRAEDAQKLAEERTLAAETAVATANSILEAVAAVKDKLLVSTRQEVERVNVERTDVQAKVVEAYQDAFVDTPEYQILVQRLMTIGRKQLVEWIMETHLEWDISFLRQAPTEVPSFEAVPGDERDGVEDQIIPLVMLEGPQWADP